MRVCACASMSNRTHIYVWAGGCGCVHVTLIDITALNLFVYHNILEEKYLLIFQIPCQRNEILKLQEEEISNRLYETKTLTSSRREVFHHDPQVSNCMCACVCVHMSVCVSNMLNIDNQI